VLQPLLAAARGAGLIVALETTNPANYAFYDALGFHEFGRLQMSAGGPLIRALRRDRAATFGCRPRRGTNQPGESRVRR
jgi:hypothetical protein